MRRIRPLGGQTEQDRPAATPRGREALSGPSVREEAILIAERLAALVESRRTGSPPGPAADAAATPPTPRPAAPKPAARSGAGRGPSAGVDGARHSGRLLGNLLVTRGFLVESELSFALARQAATGGPIGQILVDLGLITDRDLVELLAEQLRMQVIDLARVEFGDGAAGLLAQSEARRLAALPLRQVNGQIDVAIADPTDDEVVAQLRETLGAPLRLFLATRADIDVAVNRLYG